LNDHYYADYRDKFMAHYKEWRQRDKNKALMDHKRNYEAPSATITAEQTQVRRAAVPAQQNPLTRIIAGLAELGISNITPRDLAKLLPPDEMEPALTIMASVRAYFQGENLFQTIWRIPDQIHQLVAYKRFADNIVLAIDRELVSGLKDGIEVALNTGLGITGPDGQRICRELVQERPNVSSRREELAKKWERLNTASQDLVQVGI
jgi:hypothetical protein